MPPVNYYELALQEDLNIGVGTTTKRNPGGGSLPGTQIGIHSLAVGQVAATGSWSTSTLTALGTTTFTVTVPGAEVGDFVLTPVFEFSLGGLVAFAEVTASNTVTVRLFNPTSTSIPQSAADIDVRVLVLKSR